MKGTTIGIDLAKQVFEVYVEDATGQPVERRRLSRRTVLPWFANGHRPWWAWKRAAARTIGAESLRSWGIPFGSLRRNM